MAFSGAGNAAFGGQRAVVVVDGVGYGVAEALVASVKAADFALKLGKFLDEFGGEVGLAESGGYSQRFEVEDEPAFFRQ